MERWCTTRPPRLHCRTRFECDGCGCCRPACRSRLAGMNWRRGLVLAGINVAIALPMISILAARDAQARREWKQRSSVEDAPWIDSSGEFSVAPARMVRGQEEQTVTFSPCGLWANIPVQESVVQFGNLPVFVVTQWRVDCPSRWSVARILGVNDEGILSDKNFRAMRRVDAALCFLIAVQWFLIGSMPLVQPKRWWSEPGAFITACTVIRSAIALIPVVDVFGRLPVLIAFVGWLLWAGLLIWVTVRWAWQSTLGGLRRLNN